MVNSPENQAHTGNLYTNTFLPDDARLLRWLYKNAGECSKTPSWLRVDQYLIVAKILGAATIPVAALSAVSYSLRGGLRAVVHLNDLQFYDAAAAFARDELSAIQCVALTIGNIAYAILGIICGKIIYANCIPKNPAPTALQLLQNELRDEKNTSRAARESFRAARESLDDFEAIIVDFNQTINQLENDLSKFKDVAKDKSKEYSELISELHDRNRDLADDLKQKCEKFTKDIANLQAQLEEKNTLSESQKSQISQLNKLLGDCAAKYTRVSKRLSKKIEKNEKPQEVASVFNPSSESTTKKLKPIPVTVGIRREKETGSASNLISKLSNQGSPSKKSSTTSKLPNIHRDPVQQNLPEIKLPSTPTFPNPNTPPNSREEDVEVEDHLTDDNTGKTNRDQSTSVATSVVSSAANLAVNGVSLAAAGASLLLTGANTVFQMTKKAFIDGGDTWKVHRYDVAIGKLINAIGRDEIDNILKRSIVLKDLEGTNEHNKMFHTLVHEALTTLLSPNMNGRVQYQKFHELMRKALEVLERNDHAITEQIASPVQKMCYAWFTGISMPTFFYELVATIAFRGDPNIKNTIKNQPLSQQLQLLLEAIANAPQDSKTPTAQENMAKLETIFATFDPMKNSNIPTQWPSPKYIDAEGKEVEVTYMRTGVPIGPANQYVETSFRYVDMFSEAFSSWWNDTASKATRLIPEYLAFWRSLKAQNKKLLVILHLDPAYYSKETGDIKSSRWSIFKIAEKWSQRVAQAKWIKLMVDAAKTDEFKDHVEIALLPLDGEWLTNGIQNFEGTMPIGNFIDQKIICKILEKDSPFILPKSIQENDPETFLKKIADEVKEGYFQEFLEENDQGKSLKEMNKDEMVAFVALFYARLGEAMQFKCKANIVQQNCKDAIDRTVAMKAVQLLDMMYRLGRMTDFHTRKLIIGTILGPALAILKRGMLKHRFEFLQKAAEYLESLPSEKLGSLPNLVEGHTLVDMKFDEDQYESLYPAPASARSAEDYKALLQIERKDRYSLPPRILVPSLYAEISGMPQADPQLETALKEKGYLEGSRKKAVIAIGQQTYAPVMAYLKQRYACQQDNDVNYEVIPNTSNDHYRVYKSEQNGNMLRISRTLNIQNSATSEILSQIKVKLDINLDKDDVPPSFRHYII